MGGSSMLPVCAHSSTPQSVLDLSWQMINPESEPTAIIPLEFDPDVNKISSQGSTPSVGSQSSRDLLCRQHENRSPPTISRQLEENGPTVGQNTGSAPNVFILPLEGLVTNSPSRHLDATFSNEANKLHIVPYMQEHNYLLPQPVSAECSIPLSGQLGPDNTQGVGSECNTFNTSQVSCDDNQVQVDYEDQRSTPPQSSSPLEKSSQADIMSSPIQHVGFEDNMDEASPTLIVQPVINHFVQEGHIENTSATVQARKRKRCESLPREAGHLVSAPNPKRLTIKSQRKQHEKLKSPFRSPLLSRTEGHIVKEPRSSPGRNRAVAKSVSIRTLAQKVTNGKERIESNAVKEAKQIYRTQRAATQFKSPLPLDAVSKQGDMVRMTPDIQTLERKLQALKRAVKIKQQNQEHVLEELAQKWTYAGREVAWELWSFVKDKDTPGGESYRPYDEPEWRQENFNLDSSDSACAESIDGDDDSKRQETDIAEENSFGMMLRQLGIDPKTLGWKEEEEGFVDD